MAFSTKSSMPPPAGAPSIGRAGRAEWLNRKHGASARDCAAIDSPAIDITLDLELKAMSAASRRHQPLRIDEFRSKSLLEIKGSEPSRE